MRMNSRISCPNCGGEILGERFIAKSPYRSPWYKFERQDYRCPHCGVALAYDRRTNLLIAGIGLCTVALVVLVPMNELPVLSTLVLPSILFGLFFKVRRLVVRPSHNKPVHPRADAPDD